MLHEDTSELAGILERASESLSPDIGELDDFLAQAPEILAGYAPVEDLQALNHLGRQAVDALMRHCHEKKDADEAGAVHEELRGYLQRHSDRESAFFFPVFVGRPV